tara:strand:+ start:35 stop:316 length:282 start_codon:yes stop_codon:yes gene_type:complete
MNKKTIRRVKMSSIHEAFGGKKEEELGNNMSEEKTEWWAVVRWSIDDIKKVKPKWTNQECHDFLQRNEKHMRDRMIETGWDIIDILIQEEVTS